MNKSACKEFLTGRNSRAIILLVAGSMVGLGCWALLGKRDEPTYQGKPAKQWFREACTKGVRPIYDDFAKARFELRREFVPLCLETLSKPDDRIRDWYSRWSPSLPAALRRVLPAPYIENTKHVAVTSLYAIIQRDSEALAQIRQQEPIIRELLSHKHDRVSGMAADGMAGTLLFFIKTGVAEPAVITSAHIRHPDFFVRVVSALLLARSEESTSRGGLSVTSAVPGLIETLTNDELKKIFGTNSAMIRQAAALLLERISPDTALKFSDYLK